MTREIEVVKSMPEQMADSIFDGGDPLGSKKFKSGQTAEKPHTEARPF